ncbi:phosphoribosylformylglycinamidine cyclo-ligase [Candidatus Sumerlaeota bacterium]|nr:phosphoribosylformylglycinamidine cyclo-ligase [Candidatus Sumerlaeota bacterium]
MARHPLTYKQAGHDLDRSDATIERLKKRLPKIGGFGGLFPFPKGNWKSPVLVSSTDGVGTKLLVAIQADKHDTVGIDLVAMVVNDLIVPGAKPLFLLDYIGTGVIDPQTIEDIVAGVIEGCRQAGCELSGGETAELAGMYAKGHYDLAAFGVGVVERRAVVDGRTIRPGDVVIGLESSGLHSNGYTLARAVFDRNKIGLRRRVAALGMTAGEALLEPTRIYVPAVLDLLKRFRIKGMANITGGGLGGNLNRTLPADCNAEIDTHSWPRPAIFDFMQEAGPVEEPEMFRTFNMGIGYTLVVSPRDVPPLLRRAARLGFPAHPIGKIVQGRGVVRLK